MKQNLTRLIGLLFLVLSASCKKYDSASVGKMLAGNEQTTAQTRSAVARNLNSIYFCAIDMYCPKRRFQVRGVAGHEDLLWTKGRKRKKEREIRVRFVSNQGSIAVREKVKQISKEWEKHAYVTFRYVVDHEAAHIVIGLDPNEGAWSFIGKRSLLIDQAKTMNLGWLDDTTTDYELKRVVLHEFGHVLGLEHEHFHPKSKIVWDREKVFEYFEGQFTPEQIEENLFGKFAHYCSHKYDPKSIMIYAIPAELTLNGVSIEANAELSSIDKAFIRQFYPFPNDR